MKDRARVTQHTVVAVFKYRRATRSGVCSHLRLPHLPTVSKEAFRRDQTCFLTSLLAPIRGPGGLRMPRAR